MQESSVGTFRRPFAFQKKKQSTQRKVFMNCKLKEGFRILVHLMMQKNANSDIAFFERQRGIYKFIFFFILYIHFLVCGIVFPAYNLRIKHTRLDPEMLFFYKSAIHIRFQLLNKISESNKGCFIRQKFQKIKKYLGKQNIL